MAITDAATPADAPSALDPRRWWMLGVLCLSLLIVFVGNSSLNVTIPTLSRDLHASESQLQWVVASYSLVFAGLLFSTGALGDRFGRKGALQFGLVGFLAGAALASVSTAMWQLIACRALMGAAAAFIMPSTLSIIVNVFPAQERTKAIAFWAATTGAAGAGAERRVAEETQVEHRLVHMQFPRREHAEHHDGDRERAQRFGAQPTVARSFDQPVHERADADDRQHRAHGIQCRFLRVA
jgi:sugar phosphate permease